MRCCAELTQKYDKVLKALIECHTITISLCMRRPEKVEIELSDNLCRPFLLYGCSQGEKGLLIDEGSSLCGVGDESTALH